MAKVPLAGTEYVPGVTEEKTLDEMKQMLESHLEDRLQLFAGAPGDVLALPGLIRRRTTMSTDISSTAHTPKEPEKIQSIDAEYLSGRRFPYQEDPSLIEDIDLLAATPGGDINWLEDITLLEEDGTPAVFDRYSNSFLKIYFPIPEGREDETARKVLIKHLTSRQLVRHPAQGALLQVPPARARPVGAGLADGGDGLEAGRAGGLGAAGALNVG